MQMIKKTHLMINKTHHTQGGQNGQESEKHT